MSIAKSLIAFLLFGACTFAEELFDKGFLNQHLTDYVGRGFEWENNRIGITDEVPAPWSPVEIAGRTVSITHRILNLGERNGTKLFEQMTSMGVPLLEDGVTFSLTDASDFRHNLTLDAIPFNVTDASIVFRGETDVPGGKAILECRVEFDGFIHLGLDLVTDSNKPMVVHDLRLTASLRRAAASHYKYNVPYNFTTEVTEDGRIPSTGLIEKDIRLPFSPTLWLGTPNIGLEWMCESNHGWNLKQELNAVLIRPVKDRVIWTNVMINQPTTISKARHYACAFYILPTRPAPFPGWNADSILVNSDPIIDFREALAPWHTFYGVHRNTSPTPNQPKAQGKTLIARLRHFGMNEPFAEGSEAIRYVRERAELRAQNIRYLPYTTLHGLPTDLPSDEVKVDKRWLDQWDLRTAKEGHKHYFYTVLQHKSVIDFQLYYALRTIVDHKLDGQYFDLSQPRSAGGYARRHTTDFDRDTFYMPLFGYREFSKRFYIATTKLNPQFLAIQHAVIPTGISSAYAVGSGGEHLKRWFSDDDKKHTHKINEEGKTQLDMDLAAYAPDYFKIPGMMYPVGNWMPVFGENLSFSDILKGTAEYYREHPDRLIYYCRTFLARSLVHGVPIWIRSLDMPETIQVYRALDAYGPRTETQHVHSATATKTHLVNSDKEAFEYRIEQKPGRLLLIVSNSSLDTKTSEFDLSTLLPKDQLWSLINAETKESISMVDGKFRLSIAKHDFRIVIGSLQP